MTENQKQLKIAFVKSNYGETKGYKVMETWSGSGEYKDENNLIDNVEFEAELHYCGFSRGRSSLNIALADHRKRIIYYSGMSLLDEALKGGIVQGDKITGTFCFKKQGTSILLQQI